MNVAEVVALLTPMFREMLHDDELASLRFGIVPMDDFDGPHQLRDDDPVRSHGAVVRWQILGERGWSRGLDGDDDPAGSSTASRATCRTSSPRAASGGGSCGVRET